MTEMERFILRYRTTPSAVVKIPAGMHATPPMPSTRISTVAAAACVGAGVTNSTKRGLYRVSRQCSRMQQNPLSIASQHSEHVSDPDFFVCRRPRPHRSEQFTPWPPGHQRGWPARKTEDLKNFHLHSVPRSGTGRGEPCEQAREVRFLRPISLGATSTTWCCGDRRRPADRCDAE